MNYYDRQEVSNSDIKLLLTSPLHYIKKEKRKVTPAMEFGTNFHSFFLEGEKFGNETIITDLNLTTKEGKEVKQQAEIDGKTIIKQDDYYKFLAMSNNLRSHPLSWIFDGDIEVETEIYFNWENVDCRSRLDMINHDIEAVIDLNQETTIENISVGFLENKGSWIHFPVEVNFYQSLDNLSRNIVEKLIEIPSHHLNVGYLCGALGAEAPDISKSIGLLSDRYLVTYLPKNNEVFLSEWVQNELR
jgi:hypothetical protein